MRVESAYLEHFAAVDAAAVVAEPKARTQAGSSHLVIRIQATLDSVSSFEKEAWAEVGAIGLQTHFLEVPDAIGHSDRL
jgi:hypothetical protein